MARARSSNTTTANLGMERWLVYRDSRNDTAHHYGEQFAEQTL